MPRQTSSLPHSIDTTADPAAWRRNLAAVWAGQLLAMIGFSFAFPFIPLYVQELGIRDQHEVELWAGLLAFASGLSMAISAPIWGALADRHGRKAMVLRATLGGAALVAAMGLATNVQQLFVLRFLQGTVTGVTSASNSLVASFTPRERVGFALGAMQTSIFAGYSLGPLLGGVIADNIGFRYSFFLTGAMLALAGLVVLFFVHEGPRPTPKAGVAREPMFAGLGRITRMPAIVALIAVVFAIQASTNMVSPIFPLFVQALTPEARNVGSTVGFILGAGGVVSAFSAIIIGRFSDRLGHRRVLAICALGAGLSYLPQSMSTDPTQVLVWRACLGLFVGGMLPAAHALMVLRAPASAQGAAFGLTSTASSLAHAVGPLLGALLATQLGLRAVFIAAGTLLLTTGLYAASMRVRPAPLAPPSPLPRDSQADA
ncbi:MAG: MFS transporter [Chloroflexota bacterium]